MDAALHVPHDPVSILGIGGGGPGTGMHVGQHELVQPIRQLLSSVVSNHPGTTRPLEEELSQLETSDENFHRWIYVLIIEKDRKRSALFLNICV